MGKNNENEEQERLLALQRTLAPRSRVTDLVLIAALLALLFGFAAAGWLLPDRAFSEQENRALQTAPALTSPGGVFADRLLSGKFTAEVARYYADQFPLRDTLVGVKAAMTLSAGRRENNGILAADGGHLIDRSESVPDETVRENTAALSAFARECAARGIGFTALAVPRSADALTRYVAAPAPDEHTEELRALLAAGLSDAGYLDLYDTLLPRVEAGEYLYYRTDHHWTTEGAYYGYAALAGAWGLTPAPASDFTRETASAEFFGTTWSAAGMKWTPPDTMEFWRYEGDGDFRVLPDGREERLLAGFYDRSYLEKKDKYGAFLSGNNGRLSIWRVGADGERVAGRETVVILKDSFAHALIPFLARDYDLEVIDLRYYKRSVLELLGECAPARVLALYNYDSFLAENAFALLRLGGGAGISKN